MSKLKVLICGGTGFIGRNFVERFAASKDFDVHSVCFRRPSYSCSNVTWHQVDLRNPTDVDKTLKNVDIVIQAAATTSGSKDIVSQPYIHVTDNAVMNSYLFRSAVENNVKHVIFFSCAIMYHNSTISLSESDFDANRVVHPNYFGAANTKVYLEKMCEFYAGISNTRFTAIRHSNIYGPHDKFDLEKSHVFGATVTKVMLSNGRITVWGSGEEGRDLLYITDLLRFVELVLAKQKRSFELYNCGYGRVVSIKELVEKIIRFSGKNIVIRYDTSKPSIKTSLSLNCNRARDELGWVPQVNLDEGIKFTLDWWQKNKSSFEKERACLQGSS